jgi:hypothetical protein
MIFVRSLISGENSDSKYPVTYISLSDDVWFDSSPSPRLVEAFGPDLSEAWC